VNSRFAAAVIAAAILALALAQAGPEVEITAEPHHHLLLQNQYVRVFKVEVAPHEATLMHYHSHDYIDVTLGAAEISNEVKGKPPATVKLQDGEVKFTAGHFAHIARDLANTPFRNITIEFMRDQQAHGSGRRWKEKRGLQVFSGGTQHILFVEDGVRVSDIELQSAGVLPKHHHRGPHLVVALTDLVIRSQVPGATGSNIESKAGDVKWVPGGFTHTLTNVGDQSARFVTLEFH
jgi:quercetin dioxygenase-like cupin family protein